MIESRQEFIAAGANRHPSAADWSDNILAFGSGNNIALWNPQAEDNLGVSTLLKGHADAVNAVRLFREPRTQRHVLISGSADKTVRIWKRRTSSASDFQLVKILTDHTASINAIAVLPSGLFITGAADATVKIWQYSSDSGLEANVHLIQSVDLTPRFFPLAVAITQLSDNQVAFAVAGTTASIRIFVQKEDRFSLGATLSGHEGWVRSLDFVCESHAPDSDLLLASASQDKYIRLWRFHKGSELPAVTAAASDPALGVLGRALSNKAHYIGEEGSKHSITFEALLIGHEDWIYTARWHGSTDGANPRLLTASADNSLAVWERDSDSGFWTCTTRLGEISAQKGSTSATGSTGGFWIGLWSSEGETLVSLGRTGSWRRWTYRSSEDRWIQQIGISGHVREVKDVAWSRDGTYLMSTGSDQTTRLYAEWKRDDSKTWHEMARPQIHGYDLNCIDATGKTQFISGADEKLLRVFNKPKAVASLLNKLGGIEDESLADLPEAANIPVLGLSNKAITAASNDEEAAEAVNGDPNGDERSAADPSTAMYKSTLDLSHPPFEDHLARHTLWPEHEKLYGHGYEISAVAASHDGSLVATACRASSIDHAVIRLYETKEWREVKPVLTAHSLTVTSLSFSPDDQYLLSTGRDRQWALFEKDAASPATYTLVKSNPKGHSRMILDCSWAPSSAGFVFATAGRDKSVKIWQVSEQGDAECKTTLATSVAATAVAFLSRALPEKIIIAYGMESGEVRIAAINSQDWTSSEVGQIQESDLPSASINALRWRPQIEDEGQSVQSAQLAVASDDHSLRLYTFHGLI